MVAAWESLAIWANRRLPLSESLARPHGVRTDRDRLRLRRAEKDQNITRRQKASANKAHETSPPKSGLV